MAVLPRLLKVGSMTESLGVYVPASVFQRALGLGRMLLFMYLMREAELGLWGLGAMIFTMASSLVTLGSNHGLVRYVSFYEARGQLEVFYRGMRWRVFACAVILVGAAMLGSGAITRHVIVSRLAASEITYNYQLSICMVALANAALLSLYHNMLGFLVGMRRYRAVSVLEISFAISFTALGTAALLIMPKALALLAAHLVALAMVFVAGMILLQLAMERLGRDAGHEEVPSRGKQTLIPKPDSDTSEPGTAMPLPVHQVAAEEPPVFDGFFTRVLRFGFVEMVAGFLWLGAGYISFWLTSNLLGKVAGGVFFAFLLLGQSILALANAAGAVIFTHVAKLWESGERRPAVFILETSYKALALGTMTLSVLVYVTSPLWVKIIPQNYHSGRVLLIGLLMFFQAGAHLILLNILARLHERPIMVALGALAGGVANVLLAIWWIPQHGAVGAALAAGVGMYAGMMAVSLAYFLIVRARMHLNTYFIMATPAMLLLPKWTLGLMWITVLIVTISTTWLLDARQKRILSSSGQRILKQFETAVTRRGAAGA